MQEVLCMHNRQVICILNVSDNVNLMIPEYIALIALMLELVVDMVMHHFLEFIAHGHHRRQKPSK